MHNLSSQVTTFNFFVRYQYTAEAMRIGPLQLGSNLR